MGFVLKNIQNNMQKKKTTMLTWTSWFEFTIVIGVVFLIGKVRLIHSSFGLIGSTPFE
jgi:hypothetical protein